MVLGYYEKIITDLRSRKAMIEGAVVNLLKLAEESDTVPARAERNGRPRRKSRAKLSPQARRKLSIAMKRRWASGEMARLRR